MDDMGGSSGFEWTEGDVAKWEAFAATLPDIAVDNWEAAPEEVAGAKVHNSQWL